MPPCIKASSSLWKQNEKNIVALICFKQGNHLWKWMNLIIAKWGGHIQSPFLQLSHPRNSPHKYFIFTLLGFDIVSCCHCITSLSMLFWWKLFYLYGSLQRLTVLRRLFYLLWSARWKWCFSGTSNSYNYVFFTLRKICKVTAEMSSTVCCNGVFCINLRNQTKDYLIWYILKDYFTWKN